MLITAALIIVSILFIMAWLSKTGHPPGLINNTLSPCPNKPNCVCSEYDHDTQHYISPLMISMDALPAAIHAIKVSTESLGGEVTTQNESYLAATFASAFFGFIDDVEFRVDSEQQLIHIRSSARSGHSDFGINQKRAQALKTKLHQTLTQLNSHSSDQ